MVKRKLKAVKALEAEKATLSEKTKNMAEIIERLSSEYQEPPKVPDELQTRLNKLEENLETKDQQMRENLSNLEKVIKKSRAKDDLTDITTEIKENIEPRFERIEKQLSAVDRINVIEEKMDSLVEKIAPKKKASAEEQVKEIESRESYQPMPIQTARLAISDITILKNDIDDTKKSIKIIAASLSDLKDELINHAQDTNNKIKEIRNLKDLTDVSKKEIDVIERERNRLYETVETIEKRLLKRIENTEKNQESLYRLFDDQIDFLKENTLRREWVKDHKKEEKEEMDGIRNEFVRQLDNFRKEVDKIHDSILQMNSMVDHSNEKINKIDASTVKQKWIEEHDRNEDDRIKKIETNIKSLIESNNQRALKQIDEMTKEYRNLHDKQILFENSFQKIKEKFEKEDEWKKTLEKDDKNLRNSINERFDDIRNHLRVATRDTEVTKDGLKDSIVYLQNQMKVFGENSTVFKDDMKSETDKIHDRMLKLDSTLENVVDDVNKLGEVSVKTNWVKEHEKKEKELMKVLSEENKKLLKSIREEVKTDMKEFKKDQSEKSDGRIDKLEKEFDKLYEKSIDRRWAENYEKIQSTTIQKIKDDVNELKSKLNSFGEHISVSKEDITEAENRLHEKIISMDSYIKGIEKRLNVMDNSSVKTTAISEYQKAQKDTIERVEERFEKRLLELEKLIVGVRNSYDSVLRQTLVTKKETEKTSSRQKERINTLLKELSV